MEHRPITHRLLLLLLLAGSALAGCGARNGAGETAVAGAGSDLVLDLPALVVDYDADGNPSAAGVPLSQLQSVLPSSTVTSLTLPKSIIDQLTGANIQHLQLSNTPNGLRILINGQPVPSLVWDTTTLTNATDLAGTWSKSVPASVKDILPILAKLGAGIVLRFPLAQGADIIPIQLAAEQSNAVAAQQAQKDFLSDVGSPPVIQIPVYYDAEGNWTVQGMTDAEWQALTGLPFGALRLTPEIVRGAAAAGIRQVTVRTDPQGIHLALNGKELPYMSWANGEIATTLQLAQQYNALPDGIDPAVLSGLLYTILPAAQSSQLTIQVYFPAP